jgi:hypothetical protein
MYKNLCAIYSSRHSGTVTELLRPNADEVYAILQHFGRTYYDCAGWQNDPSLNPLLFDTTFLQTLLHRVTRVRSRNYVRELEASSATVTQHSRPHVTHTGINTRPAASPIVTQVSDAQDNNHGMTIHGATHDHRPTRYTGTISSGSSTSTAHSAAAVTIAGVFGEPPTGNKIQAQRT